MLELVLSVERGGEIGSDFWVYDIITLPGRTVSARAGYVEARLISAHYILRDTILDYRLPFDVLDRGDVQEADSRMIENIKEQLRNFLKNYEKHNVVIIDNDQFLGDLSDLIP